MLSPLLLLSSLFFVSPLLFLIIPTQAQDFTPTPYFSPQSVFVDGSALFVHGGLAASSSSAISSTQTFFINLTASWNTSAPEYHRLSGRYTGTWSTACTLLRDKETWLFFDNQTNTSQFDIGSSNLEWVDRENLQLKKGFSFPAVAAVTDPETGQVFVVDGWNSTGLLRYFTGNETIDKVGPAAPVSEGYTAIWSTLRRGLLIYGGTIKTRLGTYYPRTLYQFFPSNSDYNITGPIYATLSDSGTIPPPRSGHCMVETKGGTKIVLFGGFDPNGLALADIYVLDVVTLVWTAGEEGDRMIARGYAACGMSNSLFVAWGGAIRDPMIPTSRIPVVENVTLVFNLTSNKWQSTFLYEVTKGSGKEGGNGPSLTATATTELLTTATSTPTFNISPTSTPVPSIGAAIGGSVVGGLTLLIAAGVGLFIYRRRARQNRVLPVSIKPKWSMGEGGGHDDNNSSHKSLQPESPNGSKAGSIFIVREVSNPKGASLPLPLTLGPQRSQQQQQQSKQQLLSTGVEVTARKGGGSNVDGAGGSESRLEVTIERLEKARRDPQLVTIGRAFTYRDSVNLSTSSTEPHL